LQHILSVAAHLPSLDLPSERHLRMVKKSPAGDGTWQAATLLEVLLEMRKS